MEEKSKHVDIFIPLMYVQTLRNTTLALDVATIVLLSRHPVVWVPFHGM